MSDPAVVLSVPRFQPFAETLLEHGNFVRGETAEETFPNGEIRREILTADIRGKNVVIVGSTDDADILGLFSYANQAARDARTVTLAIPFFRYAAMERRNGRDGLIIAAKDRADILSAIPRASQGNNVVMFDLHAEAVEHYFRSDRIVPRPVRCEPVIAEAIRKMIEGDLVIASADSGRHDWITSLAEHMGLDYALVNKKRIDGTRTIILGDIVGSVEGKTVVMYDDMIRTGGTAIKAADKYLSCGAKEIWLVATHADFSPDAMQKLSSSQKIAGVITTNSYPTFMQLAKDYADFYRVVPLEPYAGASIQKFLG